MNRDRDAVERPPDPEAELATVVAGALSEATGRSVAEIDASLNDHVDPDALEQLFAPRHDGTLRSGGEVVFTMLDHAVTVRADGRVVVVPR